MQSIYSIFIVSCVNVTSVFLHFHFYLICVDFMQLDDVWVSLTLPQSSDLPLGVRLHPNSQKTHSASTISFSDLCHQMTVIKWEHANQKQWHRCHCSITSPLTCGWRSWQRTRGYSACVGTSCTQRNYPHPEVARWGTAHSAEKTGTPEQRRDGVSHTELWRDLCICLLFADVTGRDFQVV